MISHCNDNFIRNNKSSILTQSIKPSDLCLAIELLTRAGVLVFIMYARCVANSLTMEKESRIIMEEG